MLLSEWLHEGRNGRAVTKLSIPTSVDNENLAMQQHDEQRELRSRFCHVIHC